MKKIIVAAAAFLVFAGCVHAQTAGAGPTVPQGMNASVSQSNQVVISWGASTDTSATVVGYHLFRNGAMIANVADTSFTDNVPAGVYSYAVSAYDVNGMTSAQSVSAQVTVLLDNVPPTTPTGLQGSVSSSSATLSWNPSTDNFGVIGYYVYRNTIRVDTTAPIAATTYTDTGLVVGTKYTYSVVAYDAAGNVSASAAPISLTTILDITPPSVPQGITAVPVSSSQINLSWKPSTDNIQVAGYNIYRNNIFLIAVGTSTTYSDIGLTAATPYFYSVAAIDSVGNVSVQGTQANATTPPLDITPPSIPANFIATPISSSQVTLSWSASTDNVTVAGYNLFNNGTQIATIPSTSTTYTDINLATSTTYEYSITAFDTAGNVSPQTSVAVKTLASTPAVVVATPAPLPVSPAPSATPVGTSSPAPTSGSTPSGSYTFTTTLYYGLRGTAVTALQKLLVGQGDLAAVYATGFFGSLTQKAVQKLQCDQNIICSGSPFTTGWGSTGPRTRRVLNSL
jgi:fibronectin type 3 domain-containing protein